MRLSLSALLLVALCLALAFVLFQLSSNTNADTAASTTTSIVPKALPSFTTRLREHQSCEFRYDAFVEKYDEHARAIDALAQRSGVQDVLLLNLTTLAERVVSQTQGSIKTLYDEQRVFCTVGNGNVSLFRQRSAWFLEGNASQAAQFTQSASLSRPRVACVVVGLMRSYQEVLLVNNGRMDAVLRDCDIFISTDAIRGLSQLRFGVDIMAALRYNGIERDIAMEINATYSAAIAAQRTRLSEQKEDNQTNPSRLRSIHVAPRSEESVANFAREMQRDARMGSLPLYKHMLEAWRAIRREETARGFKYDVVVQLRPDLTFPERAPPPLRFFFASKDRDQTLFLVWHNNVVPLGPNNVAVPGRYSLFRYRTSDYMTIGSRAAMERFLSGSYYLLKHVAKQSEGLVSERAKRVLLDALGIAPCLLFPAPWAPAPRKRGRRPPNSVFCHFNCTFHTKNPGQACAAFIDNTAVDPRTCP